MINMIRADFYRLLRSRGFWISQILFVTFFSFLIFAKSAGNAGIMRQEAVSIDDKLVRTWTAANTMQAFSLMSSMVVFFLLASTMILIGTDLTHRTIKNQLTSGISRGTFFISKYLTFFILSFCQLIAFYGLAFVVGGLKNGWGDLTTSFWSHFLTAFGIQLLSLQAIYALVLLELYLTFLNVLAVLMAAVASPILIPLLLQLISYVWKNQLLYSLDFQGNMTIAWVNMPDHYWPTTVVVSLLVIVVCLSLAFLSFKKRDL